MTAAGRGRALVILAVGCLALDGVLLFLAGYWGRRPGLLGLGAGFAIAAILVIGLRRRQLRAMREVDAARRAAADEARALARLVRNARGAGE
jgi:hypothetical protein